MFYRIGVAIFRKISQNLQENKRMGSSFDKVAGMVFSCKHCEIFKNRFFIEQLRRLLLLSIFFNAFN